MHRLTARAAIVRWDRNGTVFAYSYALTPVAAHRIQGKWQIDSEVGCVFDAAFIDDRGDGVFRLLVPGRLTEVLVPAWLTLPNAN